MLSPQGADWIQCLIQTEEQQWSAQTSAAKCTYFLHVWCLWALHFPGFSIVCVRGHLSESACRRVHCTIWGGPVYCRTLCCSAMWEMCKMLVYALQWTWSQHDAHEAEQGSVISSATWCLCFWNMHVTKPCDVTTLCLFGACLIVRTTVWPFTLSSMFTWTVCFVSHSCLCNWCV